jgi:hypothetical protein
MISLTDFVKAERRKECPVCQLPEEAREQMRVAQNKSIRRATVIAWLAQAYGVTITDEALNTHYSGKHDA